MKWNSLLAAGLALLSLPGIVQAKTVLNGDTNHPKESLYLAGDKVQLIFKVTGLTKPETLSLRIVDEENHLLRQMKLSVKPDAKGNAEVRCDAPGGKYGFYRVYGQLSDGTKIAARGTRRAGELTYAVLMDPKLFPAYPDDEAYFGMNLRGWFGCSWFIGGAQWRHLEPNAPGEYVHSKEQESPNPKNEFFRLRSRKNDPRLNPLKPGEIRNDYCFANVLPDFPKWMKDNPKYMVPGSGGVLTPEGERVLGEFCGALARNWAKAYSDHPKHYYQITWELSRPIRYKGTWKEFVRIYEVAVTAIRKNDPKAFIIGFTMGFDFDKTREVLEAGLGKYIDGLSHHSYMPFPPEANGAVDRIRRYQEMVRKAAGRDIPIYGTEFGFATQGLLELENVQMFGILRGNLIMLGEGYKKNICFYPHDYYVENGFGVTYHLDSRERQWVPRWISPKPFVPAYAAQAILLEGHRSVGPIEYLGDTAWGYAYQTKKGHVVLVLWDWSGKPRSVEIPVGRKSIEVADMMGNITKKTTKDGMLSLTLTEHPCYILDADPEIWGRSAVKTIQVKQQTLATTAGQTVTLEGFAAAGKKALEGELVALPGNKLQITHNTKKIKLNANGKIPFRFVCNVPGTLPVGRYPVQFLFRSNGKTLASAGVMLSIRPPLSMESCESRMVGRKPAIRLILQEQANKAAEGTASLRIPGCPDGRKTVAFSLKPGERKVIDVVYDSLDTNPLKDFRLEISFRMKNGYKFQTVHTMNLFASCYRPAMKPGDGAEAWKGIPLHPFSQDQATRSKQYHSGEKDLSASIQSAWNKDWIFFRVLVKDDVFYPGEPNWKTWFYDSVQMAFTRTWRMKSTSNDYLDKLEQAYNEIDFALTTKGPYVFRTITFDDKKYPIEEIPLKECPLTVIKTQKDGGVQLEYRIAVPWKFMNRESPKAGDFFGWSCSINDRDAAPGPDQTMTSGMEAFEFKKPALFGKIILAE